MDDCVANPLKTGFARGGGNCGSTSATRAVAGRRQRCCADECNETFHVASPPARHRV